MYIVKLLLLVGLRRRLEALVSVGGLEATQTSMHYCTLFQACDCHGMFVDGVIIFCWRQNGSVDMINARLTSFALNRLETILNRF